MSERFTRADRLSRREEISRVFRGGLRTGDDRILLISRRNDESDGRRRLAVTVSRKHGPAVFRNRLKRLCREAFRTRRDALPPGRDYVILPRYGVVLDLPGVVESIEALGPRLARQLARKERQA